MADKRSLLGKEKLADTQQALTDIGASEYEEQQTKPDKNLNDALIRQLKPSIRKKLAARLIEIALAEPLGATGSRTSLEAIREIWDRVEGRAKVSVTSQRAENDPLMKLLSEMSKSEPVLITQGVNIIEGEVLRVVDE